MAHLLTLILGWLFFSFVSAQSGSNCRTPAAGYGYDCDWHILHTEAYNENGNTIYLTINGQLPPAPVEVKEGQRIRIKLVNGLSEDITLHFHGILQTDGYAVMDGAQSLTQSAIGQGQEFVYDFPATKAGTYWIHSHSPGQYPKGLRTPLIVRKDTDPVDYGYVDNTQDYIVSLSDWWRDFGQTEADYQGNKCGTSTNGGLEVPSERVVLNDNVPEWNLRPPPAQSWTVLPGKSYRFRFVNLGSHARFYVYLSPDRQMEMIEIDGVMLKRGQFTRGFELASGQRVSVIIKGPDTPSGSANLIAFQDSHVSHGTPSCHMPFSANGQTNMQWTYGWLDSDPANITRNAPDILKDSRFATWEDPQDTDVLQPITGWYTWDGAQGGRTKWNPRYKYYRHRPNIPFVDITNRVDEGTGVGIKDYLVPKSAFEFDDFEAQPATEVAAYLDVPVGNTHFINLDTTTKPNGVPGWGEMHIEGKAKGLFEPPDRQYSTAKDGRVPNMPSLIRALDRKTSFPAANAGTVYTPVGFDAGQTIVMPNKDEIHWFVIRSNIGDHPLHMHGHEFQLLYKGPEYQTWFPSDTVSWASVTTAVSAKFATQPPRSPARRDTVFIEKGLTYIIAIKADNPGAWAFHCHNDMHASSGMFMQLIEAPSALRTLLGSFEAVVNNNAPWKYYLNFYTGTFPTGSVVPNFAANVKLAMELFGYPGMNYICNGGQCF